MDKGWTNKCRFHAELYHHGGRQTTRTFSALPCHIRSLVHLSPSGTFPGAEAIKGHLHFPQMFFKKQCSVVGRGGGDCAPSHSLAHVRSFRNGVFLAPALMAASTFCSLSYVYIFKNAEVLVEGVQGGCIA